MEKNNKTLYIIIGALVAIIVALVVVVGMLVVRKPANNTGDGQGVAVNQPTDSSTPDSNGTKKDLFANEVQKDDYAKAKAESAGLVLDGYEFMVPGEYTLGYADNVGPYVYVTDVFQMKLGVRDRSYADYVKMGDEVTQATLDNGGSITQAPSETTINGKNYFYFVNVLMDEPGIVAFSELPEGGKTLGCQIVMENDNLSYDEYLTVFDSIITTATMTDKPNSTKDDIIQRNAFSNHSSEIKEETVLEHSGSKLTAKVAEGFYSEYTSDSETYAADHYASDYTRLMVDVYYYPEDPYFDGAKNFVDEELKTIVDYADEYETEGTKKEKLGLTDVYFGVIKYKSEDKVSSRAYGAIDINGKGVYTVEAVTFDEEDEITFDTLKTFFDIKVE